MNEVFEIARATLPIGGFYPVRLTAAKLMRPTEVVAFSVIIFGGINGATTKHHLQRTLTGKMGSALPDDYPWTDIIADDASTLVTAQWENDLLGQKDSAWRDYLKTSRLPEWVDREDPELELVGIVLRVGEPIINGLSRLEDILPGSRAAKAMKRAVDAASQVNMREG